MRKKMFIIGLMLLPAVGCSSMNNTEKGLLGGSAVGAGIGALASRGNPAAAVVGGVLGAAVGGIAGSNQDRREDHRAAVTAVANAQARNQMKLHEVIQMTQSNVGDETIIRQMDATGSCFQLSSDDIIELRGQGVSGRVINEMQARRAPRPVVIHQPVVIAPPPPYYEPAPVSVGIGVRGRF